MINIKCPFSDECLDEIEKSFFYDVEAPDNKIYCECQIEICPGETCYNCGSCNLIQKNDQITFEQRMNNFCVLTKYSRRRYMFLYLIMFKRTGEMLHNKEVYDEVRNNWLIIKEKQDNIKRAQSEPYLTFRTYFFRLKKYPKDELSNFIFHCSVLRTEKEKQDIINNIQRVLTYEKCNRIAREYNIKKKWPNRIMFLYYYFKEVFDIVEPIIFTTEQIKEVYLSKL